VARTSRRRLTVVVQADGPRGRHGRLCMGHTKSYADPDGQHYESGAQPPVAIASVAARRQAADSSPFPMVDTVRPAIDEGGCLIGSECPGRRHERSIWAHPAPLRSRRRTPPSLRSCRRRRIGEVPLWSGCSQPWRDQGRSRPLCKVSGCESWIDLSLY
jgi:hypothetical protein